MLSWNTILYSKGGIWVFPLFNSLFPSKSNWKNLPDFSPLCFCWKCLGLKRSALKEPIQLVSLKTPKIKRLWSQFCSFKVLTWNICFQAWTLRLETSMQILSINLKDNSTLQLWPSVNWESDTWQSIWPKTQSTGWHKKH